MHYDLIHHYRIKYYKTTFLELKQIELYLNLKYNSYDILFQYLITVSFVKIFYKHGSHVVLFWSCKLKS